VIAGLARAIPRRHRPLRRCGETRRQPRIHTFVSTSPIHLEHQMNKSQEEVLDIITDTVTRRAI
jgi:2-isopropylmalate synthase